MQRFKNWLARKLSPQRSPPNTLPWQANLRPELQTSRKKSKAVEPVTYDADCGGKIQDGGPGKNVLIRNKYVREDTGTHETLKIFSATNLNQEDDSGQDPYNSGRFDRSKSWASQRLRK